MNSNQVGRLDKIPSRIKFRRSNIEFFERLLFSTGAGYSSSTPIFERSDDELIVSLFLTYFAHVSGVNLSAVMNEDEFERRRELREPVRPTIFNSTEVNLEEIKARAMRAKANVNRAMAVLHPRESGFMAEINAETYPNPYGGLMIFSDDEIAELAAVSGFDSPVQTNISGDFKFFIGAALDRAARTRK